MNSREQAVDQGRLLVVIVGVVDLLLIIANVVHWTFGADDPVFANAAWDGDVDQSYIENFGHVQVIAAIVMLAFLLRQRVVMVLVAWASILVVLVIDDLFMVHERVGELLVNQLTLPSFAGVRGQDLAELLVWAALVVPLGIVLVIGHIRAGSADRRDSRALFFAVAVLALFAVVLDTVSHPIGELVTPQIGTLITLVETAGELIAMSVILIVVHRMTLRASVVTSGSAGSVPHP